MKKFLRFPEKLKLCSKFEQKWFCWDFKVLPPDYVTINQNFSPIPQIYTQPYHFDQKEVLENFPVFQKNLHCVQNLNKNGFAGILWFYPLIMWQSVKISVPFHKSTHRTLPFRPNRIFGKFPSFPEKLILSGNLVLLGF